ncbi:MAG: hypothetical protein U1F43_32570 [Myxococcota bacterium]
MSYDKGAGNSLSATVTDLDAATGTSLKLTALNLDPSFEMAFVNYLDAGSGTNGSNVSQTCLREFGATAN